MSNKRSAQVPLMCDKGTVHTRFQWGALWWLQVHVKDRQGLDHSPTNHPQLGGQPDE